MSPYGDFSPRARAIVWCRTGDGSSVSFSRKTFALTRGLFCLTDDFLASSHFLVV